MRYLAWLFCAVTLVGVAARLMPASFSDLPFVPVIVALTPWFALTALAALGLAHWIGGNARVVARTLMVVALVLELVWQGPFLVPHVAERLAGSGTPQAAPASSPTTLRVMTCNVYKGKANPARIVELVRTERVQVLALQETTVDFVEALERDGLGELLPHSSRASSDGVFGNGVWSSLPLTGMASDDIGSSASAMPAGTVMPVAGEAGVRIVSVHTCAPVPGYWSLWRGSVEEIGVVRDRALANPDTRYVLMGDFNASYDHAPFREMLGGVLRDAARETGGGLTPTWPADKAPLPALAAIDHVVLGPGVEARDVATASVDGTDHLALVATLELN